MESQDCDFSPLKLKVKEGLQQISNELIHNINSIDNEDHCLLSHFEQIKERFLRIEALAAFFYLNCYLSSYTEKYMDISICVEHLSKKRHGALIVVERKDPLDAILHSGIPIGATLTHSLLESLFYPGNPLHDGAVLIKNNMIVSATNVLPLSTSSSGGKKLGTRHRSALGLTERSDALVIVVSEETGKCSFALNGNLYPMTLEAP
ncbi:sporulation-specific diadenylate cyclase CdaS [Aneurinibacillus sp. Ricciae_BoGa-3]|uniref:sporulation-specific diadenylate cyclase CdaS n=1 Tax=Aneurinibacillus sp. Ricciae_BoGa-3 TaxID=3022697 RepID=UPI00233FC5AC|nr:sporulation-specific diadenylate cyclase CdaS [Aneurinibacillus sp. Ricciae_BoGa-3]WCK52666.1 sporulation-specific diadenylate cyclase CdaS [Aneurinibacillus sp. Ricciae_BoGa-3]